MPGMNMEVRVDDDLVMPIVEAEIQAAIVRQLDNIPDLIPKMIKAVAGQKVDWEGRPDKYGSKYTYIEWLFDKTIKEEIRSAVQEYVAGQRDELKVEVAKAIQEQRKDLARAFVDGLSQSIESGWSFKVEVKTPYDQKGD